MAFTDFCSSLISTRCSLTASRMSVITCMNSARPP
jgi:hypothetical protein